MIEADNYMRVFMPADERDRKYAISFRMTMIYTMRAYSDESFTETLNKPSGYNRHANNKRIHVSGHCIASPADISLDGPQSSAYYRPLP